MGTLGSSVCLPVSPSLSWFVVEWVLVVGASILRHKGTWTFAEWGLCQLSLGMPNKSWKLKDILYSSFNMLHTCVRYPCFHAQIDRALQLQTNTLSLLLLKLYLYRMFVFDMQWWADWQAHAEPKCAHWSSSFFCFSSGVPPDADVPRDFVSVVCHALYPQWSQKGSVLPARLTNFIVLVIFLWYLCFYHTSK